MIRSDIYEIMRPMPVFKPEMRKANRDGLKSQTRRVIEPQPITTVGFWKDLHWANESHFRKGAVEFCKYGKVGDYCYMREPLFNGFGAVAYYMDDGTMVRHAVTGEAITWRWKRDVLTSIFMPKEAARSIYRYEAIRVERVQEISRDDARAEGVSPLWKWTAERNAIHPEHFERGVLNPHVANYSVLWDSINAERGFGWDVNPYVWVLEYVPLDKTEAR